MKSDWIKITPAKLELIPSLQSASFRVIQIFTSENNQTLLETDSPYNKLIPTINEGNSTISLRISSWTHTQCSEFMKFVFSNAILTF